MDTIIEDLEVIKEGLQQTRSRSDELHGQESLLLKRLKTLGYKSLGESKRKTPTLKENLVKRKKALSTKVEKLMDDLQWEEE